VVIQGPFTSDSRGQILTDEGAPKLIYRAANAPVYALVGRNLGEGLVGGPTAAYRERYLLAADLIYRVLRGEKASAIPVETASPEHIRAFDWRQLRRWHIREDRLPPGSLIAFRERSAWERYRRLIASVMIFCFLETALVVGMLIQRSRRRRAERVLLQSRDEVQNLAGRLIVAQEEERKRIARELLDDVSQRIASLAFLISSVKRHVGFPSPQTRSCIEDLQKGLGSLHDGIRQLSHELHPGMLDILGLAATLRKHARTSANVQG
jgi:signal transduction histidine kinase